MNKSINSYVKNDKDESHSHTEFYVRYSVSTFSNFVFIAGALIFPIKVSLVQLKVLL